MDNNIEQDKIPNGKNPEWTKSWIDQLLKYTKFW